MVQFLSKSVSRAIDEPVPRLLSVLPETMAPQYPLANVSQFLVLPQEERAICDAPTRLPYEVLPFRQMVLFAG